MKILKNNTSSNVEIFDVGLTVPASGQLIINVSDYDELAASSDVVILVSDGTLTVNNGSVDLPISDGVRLLQGGYSNKIQLDDDLLVSDRFKVSVDYDSSTIDHGDVQGLLDDDHPQYHNDARGDIRYYTKAQVDFEIDTDVAAHADRIDNPHSVTKTQIGLGSVPNIDATDRANHTGTQLANTISDFAAQVAIDETTTSLSLSSNILTYIDEDGAVTNIDLSLYLDDTNLARIVSGVLDPLTGIVTFTRDDNSTFTIDFSPLLDNQTASEVPVTPAGNLASSNVQSALEEHQLDIDGINTTTSSLQAQITSNDSEIATLQSEQTTQNTDIFNNATNISTIFAQQSTQDAAIALNTAKVSASGSIDTHSDVDTTTAPPIVGSQLQWDGVNWVPQSINNGFTIFPIWAEENGNLSPGNTQWSFGNGATGAIGIPLAFDCELFAVSLNADSPGTSTFINIQRDGANVVTPEFTANNQVNTFTAIPYTSGQLLSFQTATVSGTWTDVRICAWFRVKSSAVFPTPDRQVVSNTNVAFTSTAFAQIPGLSTNVTINDTGTVDGTLIYSAARSGFTNSESQFRVVINGVNGLVFSDTLSTFNDTGGASFFVSGLPAGTYTVLAQCATSAPILIASCQLTAVGVED